MASSQKVTPLKTIFSAFLRFLKKLTVRMMLCCSMVYRQTCCEMTAVLGLLFLQPAFIFRVFISHIVIEPDHAINKPYFRHNRCYYSVNDSPQVQKYQSIYKNKHPRCGSCCQNHRHTFMMPWYRDSFTVHKYAFTKGTFTCPVVSILERWKQTWVAPRP